MPARGDEALGDRRPHASVKAGGVGEQRGRPVTAPVVHGQPAFGCCDTKRVGNEHERLVQLAGCCSAAWSAIAFMIAFAARLTNSPPLPVTQSSDARGATSWSLKCGITYWANSSKLRLVACGSDRKST